MKRVCLICMNPKDTRVKGHFCLGKGSQEVLQALQDALDQANCSDQVEIRETLCLKHCEDGPVLKILPEHSTYVGLRAEDMQEVVEEHLLQGRKVKRLLSKKGFNRFF